MVGLIGFHWIQGACSPSPNGEHKQFIKQKQSCKDFSTSIALTHTAHVQYKEYSKKLTDNL